MITSVQKIIKIGSSNGVSLPARELKAAGLTTGDEVEITVKPLIKDGDNQAELIKEYQAFKQIYGDTLAKLAGR
jgi:antitoxin component of MazEF toxin-antitoxin module